MSRIIPKIAIFKYFTFFIVSFDLLKEPPHLHIAKEKGRRSKAAKIWPDTLEFAETGDFTAVECSLIGKLVAQNKTRLITQFEKAKAGTKIKTLVLK